MCKVNWVSRACHMLAGPNYNSKACMGSHTILKPCSKIASNSIPITVPKPKYRSCTILFGENQHPMENPTQRSNLGPSRERTQKCLPLSPRPKSRLGPPNRFAERGKTGAACAHPRRRRQDPRRLVCPLEQPSRSSTAIVLARSRLGGCARWRDLHRASQVWISLQPQQIHH